MSFGVRTLTMAEAVVPRAGVWRDAVLVLAGSALTAMAAQITIPLFGQGVAHPVASALAAAYGAIGVPLPGTPVPITGQTLAVLLVGALLGKRLAFLSLLVYLAEGLAGLPVFSLGKSAWNPSTIPGLPWILGPTAGYLFSLPLAAFVVGWLAEKGWDRRPSTTALAMVAGEAIIFGFGMLWLGKFVGMQNVVAMGLLPFILGDVVKIALAAAVLPSGWLVLRRIGFGR